VRVTADKYIWGTYNHKKAEGLREEFMAFPKSHQVLAYQLIGSKLFLVVPEEIYEVDMAQLAVQLFSKPPVKPPVQEQPLPIPPVQEQPVPIPPPTKWHVYEHILRIPYYIVFSRDPDQFRAFQLGGRRYREIKPEDGRLWFMEMNLGLGLWHGTFQEMERRWLRWYDADRKWILTSAECAEQEKQRAEREKQRAEQEKQRAEQLAAQLKALGIEPNV